MKLLVRAADLPGVLGGRGFQVTDENGVPLPMQVRTNVETAVGELGELTVVMHIDGEHVRLDV